MFGVDSRRIKLELNSSIPSVRLFQRFDEALLLLRDIVFAICMPRRRDDSSGPMAAIIHSVSRNGADFLAREFDGAARGRSDRLRNFHAR